MSEIPKSKNRPFDKERIYDYVKFFSFPRLSGTEGEKKAVDLTAKTFRDIGFKEDQIERETFEFSDFYSTTLIQLIMIMNLTFYLILLLMSYIYPFVTIIAIGAMALIVILIVRGLRHPETGFWGEYFGRTFSSTNVIVKIPAKVQPEKNAGNIIVSAHLDSKSQTFKTAWRIVLYRVWLFPGIILGILYLIFLFSGFATFSLGTLPIFLQVLIWIFTIITSFSNLLLMFLSTHNKSPGALDNASGMAIVFELSSYFINHPLDNYNLWFCQFSAEELGTMGSRVFVNKYEDQFVKGKIFQINFDMVSSAWHKTSKNRVEYLESFGVLPRKKISPVLGRYLDEAAREENQDFRGFHLSTGAHLDSVPFHLREYDAIDISTRAAARYTHNKVDTPDKVDPQKLLEACIIARKAILMLEKDFKD